jgi:hypothetical protein
MREAPSGDWQGLHSSLSHAWSAMRGVIYALQHIPSLSGFGSLLAKEVGDVLYQRNLLKRGI